MVIKEKTCTKCKVSKPIESYGNRKESKDGYMGICKQCIRSQQKKKYDGNPEKYRAKQRKWQKDNSSATIERVRKWQSENTERVKENTRKYQSENKEKILQTTLRWRDSNPEKVKLYAQRKLECQRAKPKEWQKKYQYDKAGDATHQECSKCGMFKTIDEYSLSLTGRYGCKALCSQCERERKLLWRQNNKEYMRKYARESERKRRKCPKYRVNHSISNGVRRSLTKGKEGRRTWDVLGYTKEDMYMHIESQFIDGMSWNNYGKWHIDHILPVSMFTFTSTKDIGFRQCWSLSNLQPLWAKDNILKNNTVPEWLSSAINETHSLSG